MFWLVTNLMCRTSGCARTSKEEKAEVQSGDDVAEMMAVIQPPAMGSHCDQRLRTVGLNCRSTQRMALAAAEGRISSD